MLHPKSIVVFLCHFIFIYTTVLLLSQSLNKVWCNYFRTVGGWIYAKETDVRNIAFESLRHQGESDYTRVVIVNRTLMHDDGSGPVRNLDLDTSDFVASPTALLLALILSTPISWQRRQWALLWGLLCLHGFLFLSLGFLIWHDSSEIGLVVFTPFWKAILDNIAGLLISQIDLTVPVLIWLLLVFRREDEIQLRIKKRTVSGQD